MSDVDEDIRQRLRDLADDVRTDPGREGRTLRRARSRRVGTAALTGLVVVALVAGTVAGVRALIPANHVTPAHRVTPTPTPPQFLGIWPETSASDLAAAQSSADAGRDAWRLDPRRTAIRYTAAILGWDPSEVDVRSTTMHQEAGLADVELAHTGFSQHLPPLTVALLQAGRAGASGVWSVTKVASPTIEIGAVRPLASGVPIRVTGRVTGLPWRNRDVEVLLLVGPELTSFVDPSGFYLHGTNGSQFTVEFPPPDELWAWPVTLVVRVRTLGGSVVSAQSFPLSVRGQAG